MTNRGEVHQPHRHRVHCESVVLSWSARGHKDSKLAELRRGPRTAAGEGWVSESVPSATSSAQTPLAVQLRTVGARRAIPRRIHGVRLAITSTARSERRIPGRGPGVGVDASSASTDPAGGPWRSTARSCQVPGTPRSSTLPWSSNPVHEPTTRSRTVQETRMSPAPAWPQILAAMCTAIPPMSASSSSHSPVWMPARTRCPTSRPQCATPRRSGWPASDRPTWRGGRRRCS